MEGKIDPTEKFRVGDAFTPEPVDASIVRLLVACRQLEALRRALRTLRATAVGGSEEGLHFGLLCIVGAAKEAADAFRDCDAQGAFAWLEQEHDAFEQFQSNLNFLRGACDKSAATSVYSRLLAPLRNDSAFHFNRAKVATALRAMADHSYQIAEVDEATHVLGIPLARAVLAQISWLSLTTVEKLDTTLDEIDQVRKAIVAVGQDAYFAHVRLAAEPPDPAV